MVSILAVVTTLKLTLLNTPCRLMCNWAAILASFVLANIAVFVFIAYLTDDLSLVGLDLARSQLRLNIK